MRSISLDTELLSNNSMQRPAGGGECVDAARHFRVFDQRRGVVRLEPGVDHQRAAAAPVFVVRERLDAVDVGGRIGARERDPEEIAERLGDELAVVDDDDPAEAASGSSLRKVAQKRRCRRRCELRMFGSGMPSSEIVVIRTAGLRSPARLAARCAGCESRPASRRSAGTSVARSNRFGPTAAMTTFEPALSAPPE